jgi:Calx-beta domain
MVARLLVRLHKLSFVAAFFNAAVFVILTLSLGCSIKATVTPLGIINPVPLLSISDLSLIEGQSGVVIVSLDMPAPSDIVVSYQTSNGSAFQNVNYVPMNSTLTIPTGASVGTITVQTLHDFMYEPNMNFTMQFTPPTGATISSSAVLTKTISEQNIDPMPSLQFTLATDSVPENIFGGSYSALISVVGGVARDPITVAYASTGGTAVSPNDYVLPASILTIPGAATTASFPVTIVDNPVSQPTVDVQMTISSPSANATIAAQNELDLSILNENGTPTVQYQAATSAASEAVTPHLIPVVLSNPSASTITVQYSVTGGTAVNGVNYNLSSGTLTFPPLSTTQNISMPVINNGVYTGNLTVNLNLSAPTNATLGAQSTHVHTIIDAQMPPLVEFQAATSAASAAVTPHLIPVVLSAPAGVPVTVQYSVTGGTAVSGVNYVLANGTLTFPAGTTTENISMAVMNPGVYNPGGGVTVQMTLSAATNSTLGVPTVHTHTITDTVSQPQININNVTAFAGTSVPFVVSITQISSSPVTFNYTTNNGTASQPGDYSLTSGSATIAAGQTTVTLPGVATNLSAGGKNFTMTLSSITVAAAGTTTGTATMNADPTINIGNVNTNAGTNVNFVVTLSTASTLNVTFNYATSDGTAHQPGDYTSSSGTATIAAGQTTLTLPAISTNVSGGGKNFTMTLSSNTNSIAGTMTGTATLNIMPTVSIGNVSTMAGTNANFVVTLSQASTQNITFNYASANGTAINPGDYTAGSGSATIMAGQTTLTLPSYATFASSAGKNFDVTISSITNATAGTITGIATMTAQPTLSINNVTTNAGTNVNFVATLTGASPLNVTFTYATADGTAVNPTDYAGESGTATILAGQTTYTLPAISTNLSGGGKNFTATLSSIVNAIAGTTTGTATLNLLPTISIGNTSTEAGTNATFTVSITAAAPQNITFSYSTSDGTAHQPGDYTSATGTATIIAGQTSVNLPGIPTFASGNGKNFTTTISSITNAIAGTTTGTATLSSQPTISINNVTTNAGTNASFVVTLSQASSLATTFNYATADGTAVNPTNYSSLSGSATIPAGQTTLTLPSVTTQVSGGGKNFTMSLSSIVNALAGATTGTATLIVMPTISIGNVSTMAGANANFVVTLSTATTQNITFSYATANGTAVQPGDYTSATGTATITAGQTTLTLPGIATFASSNGKNFTTTISSIVNAVAGTTTGTATMTAQPTISINNVTANAGTNVPFVVTLSSASALNTVFNYSTADGTAVNPTDYTTLSGTATIVAGQTTLTLPSVTTQLSSGGKNFTMTLSSIVNATAGTTTGTATMIVLPTINIGNVTTNAGTNAVFTVSVTSAAPQNITFNYATTDGTAVNPTDYTTATGTATILAGNTSVNLPGVTTQLSSGGKNFTMTISSIANAVAGTTTGTATMIALPTINIGNVSANAGTPANFVITLSSASTQNITFNYTTTDGTAVNPTDYTSSAGTATILAGSNSFTLPVTTALSSGGKNFTMTISSIANAIAGTTTGTATMIVMPTINIGNVTANAGTPANFVVTLSSASPQNIIFNYSTANGTASHQSGDYTSSGGTATIAAGATTLTLPVTTALSSGGKNFTMTISSIFNAIAGTTTGTATMIVMPSVSIGNVTTNAGTPANFVVTLSQISTQNITFSYATADGTATQPADYTSTSGTATIAAGATTVTLPVTTQVAGGGLNFTMSISSITNGIAGTTTGTATLNVMPTISIGNVTATAGTLVPFVVTLTSASTQNITFNYTTNNGTAAQPGDYTTDTGTATILAGATSLTLPTVSTFASSGGKNFTMTLSSVTNAVTGTLTGTATMTAQPTISIGNLVVNAGSNAVFTVTLSGTSTGAVIFNYATANGTGTQPADYTSTSGTATIAAGSTTINLPAVPTFAAGGGLNFTMTLSSISGATDGALTGTASMNAPCTWTGLAGDNQWTTTGNWSTNTVPGTSDTATFNGTCSGANCNVTINAAASVQGINITSAYTGTITQSSALTVGTSDFNMAGGTFVASAAALTFNNNLNQSAGTMTLTGSNVTFSGVGAQNITSSGTFNAVTIQSGGAVTVTGTMNIAGALTLNNAAASLAGGTISATGNVTSTAFNGGAGTILMTGTAAQTLTGTAGAPLPSYQLNKSSGTLTLSGTVDFGGNWLITAGTIAAGTSTVRFVEQGATTWAEDTCPTLNNVQFLIGTSITVSGTCNSLTITGDTTFNATNSNVSFSDEDFTLKGTNIFVTNWAGVSSVLISGTASQTISGTAGQYLSIQTTINKSSGTLTISGSLDLTSLTYTAGTVAAGTSTVTFGDNNCAEGVSPSINAGSIAFYNVGFSPCSSVVTITGTLAATNNVTITTGTNGNEKINGGTLAVGGNLSMTQNHGGTTAITLNGTAGQTITQTAGSWPTGGITVSNTGGAITQTTALALGTQPLTMNANTTWNMAGNSLTGISTLGMAAGSSIYEDCATLTYTTLSPALGNIYGGTSGSTISIANAANVNEGQTQLFVVTTAPPNCAATTFQYTTANGTAIAGTNYTAVNSASATIAAGAGTTTVSVQTIDDGVYTPTLNYTSTISNISSGVASGTLTGTGDIVNIDAMPTISIGNVTTNAGSAANFVVTSTAASSSNITFTYATANGTATQPADYTTATGTGTILAGQTTATIPVTTLAAGAGLNFTMTISAPTGATLGTPTTGTATMNPSISIGNVTTNAGTTANFVVTANATSGTNITFTYATANGTATQPADYTTATGTGTILAGATTATIPVTTFTAGGGLNFTMTIAAPVNASLGTPTTGTATLNSVLVPIYRSVGPGNTTALASGGSNAMTIGGSTATFASGLPNNVGVGDAIVYASSGQIAFISGRTSSTQYTVQSATGTNPTAASGDTTWSIYRAYTSLAAAIAGNSATNGNPSIPAAVNAFDAFTSNNNTVTGNTVWNIACYNDGVDTTPVDTTGWTTGPSNYLRIYTPFAATDVGASQRHNGSWASSGYMLSPNSSSFAINILVNSIRIEGLKIQSSGNVVMLDNNNVGSIAGTGQIYIDSNVLYYSANGVVHYGIGFIDSGAYSGITSYIYNNILFANTNSQGGGITIGTGYGPIYIYSNTVDNFSNGINSNQPSFLGAIKNNIVQGATNANFNINTPCSEGCSNNIGNMAPMPGGGFGTQGTVLFENAASYDFRLSPADVTARGTGANLSADPFLAFTTDIANNTRTTPWDIGASMASAQAMPIYRSIGPTNTTALANGGSNALTISASGVATFGSALPNNIGVGDALQYASSGSTINSIVFIYSRLSSTQYEVRTATGTTPAAATSEQTWNIFRAYTSFNNAFGSSAGTENSGIAAAVRSFDTIGGSNLVTANQQWNFACYADAPEVESGPLNIQAPWVTGLTNYMRIYAPYITSEVGVSQRHNGIWSNSAFSMSSLNLGTNNAAIALYNQNVWLDGLQFNISAPASANNYSALIGSSSGSVTQTDQISNNIFAIAGSAAHQSGAINTSSTGSSTLTFYIWNNIFYSSNGIGVTGGFQPTPASTNYFYNNTSYNVAYPFNPNGNTSGINFLKNNIEQHSAGWGTTSAITTGSDYNITDFASTSGGPHDIANAAVLFNSVDNNDFRLSPADTTAHGAGENLSGDPYLAFNTDIQDLTRTNPWDIGASEVAGGGGPTPIYRSVGPNNTTALANGTGNNLTISTGGLATFGVALPNNIGVGDALQYATTGTTINAIAFIYQRISSTQYIIRTANGGVPAARSSFTAWNIFRAYTNLANATFGAPSANTGINSSVRNFELFSGTSNNLVSGNYQWNLALYADAQDTNAGGANLANWTTSPTNYARLYTPYLPTDVGVSQRHNGVWTNSAYTLVMTDASGFGFDDDSSATLGLWIDGLQMYMQGSGAGYPAINSNAQAAGAKTFQISNNIIHVNTSSIGIAFVDGTVGPDTIKIWNNILYSDAGSTQSGITISATSAEIYNNTVVNFYNGINTVNGGLLLKNNIVQGAASGQGYTLGGAETGSNYNISNDNTSTGGANDIKNATVQFMDAPNNNYLLAPVDLVAKGAGTNLSADPNLAFTTDIVNNTRATTWDIGASMASAQPTPVYRSVGPSNTTALANGSAGNTLTIGTNGVATFSAAIPNNVGVGDALQYASSGSTINSIAFIYQRVSSTKYLVRMASGAAPTTATAEQTWNLFRAYTSLNKAVDSACNGLENTGIASAVRSFDSCPENLTTNNWILSYALYGDAVDNAGTGIILTNFNASATNYLRLYTPFAASEVGVSQRHSGVWNNSAYALRSTLIANSGQAALVFGSQSVWIDGLQINAIVSSGTGGSSFGIHEFSGTAGTYNMNISNNLVLSNIGVATAQTPSAINLSSGSGTVIDNTRIWNNIVYNVSPNNQAPGISTDYISTSSSVYAYNNTVVNFQAGFDVVAGSSAKNIMKNNIVQGAVPGSAYGGTFAAGSNYNVSSDSTTTGGANDVSNATVTFLNPSNNDYRLAPNDHTAHGAGELLIGDTNLAFYTDIKGKVRYSPWDIGADQALSYASNDILIDNLSLSNITNTTFTVTVNYSGDEDLNGTVTFYYCDATTTPGCTATAGSSVAMTRALASHTFVANISGLTAGHAVNYSAVAADVDGVYGSPINGTINNGPTINITASTTVNEGSSASLVVSLSTTSTVATTFSYATADGTAVNGTNYTSASGTATIAAGQTTVTLPNITTINTGAGPATYFTVTLSNLVGANAGTIVGTVNLFNLTNGMTVSALTTSNVSASSFNAQISFAGDVAAVGVATLYYCDATQVPGCSPLYGPPVTMTRGSGVFTASISGLASPISAGDTLNLAAVAFDTGGIMGSPLTSTVTLLSNNSLMLGSLATAVNSAGFSATATFTGDNNSNSSAMIFYCDNTASPGCVATSGSSTSMTRGTGVYTASVSSLTSTHQYSLAVVGTDTDGVYNSPLSGSVTLTGTPNPVAGLQAVAMSNSEIDLSWNSGGGTTVAYKIAFQAGATAPATCSGGVTTTNTSYAVTGLSQSSQYSFIVCALDSAATPANSSGVTATATTLGAAPSRVFVTSTTYTPNTAPLNSLANADSACAARAAAATGGALTGTWQAILSSTTSSASSRLNISYTAVTGQSAGSTGVRLLDGSPGGFNGSIVSATNLWAGTIISDINRSELATGASFTVWTGTLSTGAESTTGTNPTCASWTSNAAQTAQTGKSNSATASWIANGNTACSTAEHLYCIDTNPQYHNPPNPTNLTATAGANNVNLAWASGGGTTSAFVISYQSGAQAPANCQSGTIIPAATVGAATTYNITALATGTQYGFRVCATDNSTVAVVSPGTTALATTAAPTINIANTAAMKNSSARFVVSLTGAASSNVVFNYATADGTAVGGTDYTSTSGSATILAGQTTVTLPSVAISNTAASNAKYFTMTISSITGGANLGTLVGVGTIVDPTNGLQISSLITSNITQSSFAGQVALAAGTSVNAQITLYDCDNTVTSGCNPLNYPGTAMSIGAGAATATISGLSSPGDTYNVVVTASSPGGVIGSPLSTTVTLLSNNALTVSALRVSPSSSTAFTATINFLGDANMNSVATLFYCDDSQSSGCNPTSGSSVVMTRGAGIYTASASGLNAGDTYRVEVVATDTDGVDGAPLSTVIILPSGSASQLVVTRQPYNPMAVDSEIPLQVTIEDINGDVVTSGPDATATITLTLTSGTQSLNGTLSMAAVNGVADFIGQKVNIGANDTGDVITATKSDTSGSTGGTTAMSVASNTFSVTGNNAWFGSTATAQWMTTTGIPAAGSGNGMFNSPSSVFVDSSGNSYVADYGNARVAKFNSSGVYQGWVGWVGATPTGGAAGCTTTASDALTPGWCTGGYGFLGGGGDDFYPVAVWGDNTYLYVISSFGQAVFRFNASTGAYMGWIGLYSGAAGGMANTYTSGCSTLNGSSTPVVTPGWCVGGELSSFNSGTTNGAYDFATGITGDGTYLYVINSSSNNVQRVTASTGAPAGWIGNLGSVGGGTCGVTTGSFVGSWCTDATATSQGSTKGDGSINLASNAGGVYYDSTTLQLYVADDDNARINSYTASTGAFVGWVGMVNTVPTGGAAGCTTTSSGSPTPGWCTGGTAQATLTVNGVYAPTAITGDGTNLYILDSNYRIVKYQMSTGTYLGWVGAIGVAGSGSCGAVGAFTSSWCTLANTQPEVGNFNGALAENINISSGQHSYSTGGIYYSSDTSSLWVADGGNNRISQYNSSTGSFIGWSGATATANSTWQTSNSFGAGAIDGNSFGVELSGVFTDGTNLFVSDDNRIKKYALTTLSYEGWIGDVLTTPTSGVTGCTTAAPNSITPGWCVGGYAQWGAFSQGLGGFTNIGISYGFEQTAGSQIYSDGTFLYYANPGGGTEINRYNPTTGAFGGWIGIVGNVATGGASGCTTTSVGSVAPGWCTGGGTEASSAMGGFRHANSIYGDGTYLYILDSGTGRLNKITASTGVFVGWIGDVATQPTGGASGCSTASVGSTTPGWCTGGAANSNISSNGDGNVGGATAVTGDGTFLYVEVAGAIKKFNASTGAFVGWIGVEASNGGTCTAGASHFTGGWCSGGTSKEGGSFDGIGAVDNASNTGFSGGLYTDGLYLYVVNGNSLNISKYLVSTGAFIGWKGEIGTSPTGGDPGCNGATVGTFTPGWCTAGKPLAEGWNVVGGFNQINGPSQITGSGSFLYIADPGNFRIVRLGK